MNTGRANTLTKYGDFVGIPTKKLNIVSNPLEGHVLVQQAVIARRNLVFGT